MVTDNCGGCNQLLEPDPTTELTVCNTAGSPSLSERGVTPLVAGQEFLTVPLLTEKVSADYTFLELAVENISDSNPQQITVQVLNRQKKSFKVQLSALPNSGNYQLRWNLYIAALPTT